MCRQNKQKQTLKHFREVHQNRYTEQSKQLTELHTTYRNDTLMLFLLYKETKMLKLW